MERCFACEGPPDLTTDGPGRWLKPRSACLEHRRLALLPTGETVTAFIERRRNTQHPLEGSGLNFVINPVTVEGCPAWLDFLFEPPAVWEEVFSSKSYFEYLAQHETRYVEALFALHIESVRHEGVASPVATLMAAMTHDAKLRNAEPELMGILRHQCATDVVMAARGVRFPESPEQAERIACESFADQQLGLEELARRLVELAAARLRHLL